MLLFTALRGNIILYQGEELGLAQIEIPYAQLQDPEAIANWPLTLSRDGARTPMPWVAQERDWRLYQRRAVVAAGRGQSGAGGGSASGGSRPRCST